MPNNCCVNSTVIASAAKIPWGVDSGRSCGRLRLRSDSLWRLPMSLDPHEEPAAIQTHIGAIFISLELSRSKWLITSLVPGGGQRMSKHWVEAGDLAGLAPFLGDPRQGFGSDGEIYPIVVIQEAGLDGFWIHRSLVEEEGIESHVVDAASIAVSRRRRRAKTDKIDGEGLLRACWPSEQGEPRCARWCAFPRLRTRIAAGFVASARRRRADTACQSDQRPAVFSGDRRLRAAAPGSKQPRAGVRLARATGVRWART